MSKTLKSGLFAIIITLLVIYIGGTIYAKRIAIHQVNSLISVLTKNYSGTVQAINYQAVEANFFSLFNDDVAVNGLSIQFTQQPDNQLNIAQLEITHYKQTEQGVPLEFTVRLKQVQFDSFKRMLMTIAQREDAATYIGLLPISINPSLSISAIYDAGSKSLNFKYAISNQQQTLIQSTLLLDQFLINEPLINNPFDAILAALDNAIIISGKDKVTYRSPLDQNELVAEHGHVAQMLKDLGYKSTLLSINGQGQYSSANLNSSFDLQISLQDGGVLNHHIEYTYTKPRTMHNLVTWIRTGNYPADTENDAKLALFLLDYQDQSLTGRIINMIAENAQQTPTEVTNMIVNSMKATASSENIPQFKTALQQLASFISQPNRITLTIHPGKPYSINDINTFIVTRLKDETAFNKSLTKVDPSERLALFQAHQQQSNEKLTNFLNKLGFVVVATPPPAK